MFFGIYLDARKSSQPVLVKSCSTQKCTKTFPRNCYMMSKYKMTTLENVVGPFLAILYQAKTCGAPCRIQLCVFFFSILILFLRVVPIRQEIVQGLQQLERRLIGISFCYLHTYSTAHITTLYFSGCNIFPSIFLTRQEST